MQNLARKLENIPLQGVRGRALVVDDEATNRLVLGSLLRKSGFTVIEAVDGAEAVDWFAAEQDWPTIVFMDVMMPVMDGYEAASRIKSITGDTLVPIIFLTAMTDNDALAKCISSGGDDFLTKPINGTILSAKIHSMERISGLHAEVSNLYRQIRHDQEIARQVYARVVTASNVATDVIREKMRPATVFSGDVLLSAHAPSGDLHILLGDFTGHGLAAALGALPASEVFRAMTGKGFSAAQVLQGVNRKLYALLVYLHRKVIRVLH